MMTTKPRNASQDQDVKHLFQAIRKGKAHLTRFMMAASVTLLNCCDTDGRTPLMECCYIKEEVTRVNMVKIVRDAGADVNQTDNCGRTALIHACLQRCNDVVRLLIMHCNIVPDLEDADGNTALIHSAYGGNDVAVELLVRNFRRLGLQIDHFNKSGFTALHVACKGGFLQCAKILAVRGKATLTLKDKVQLMTPMELCLQEGYQKSDVDFLKPLTKFYKVAKLTTTIVKCRKRSVGLDSVNSVTSLRVSPIKVVKKVKQKSLGLLKKAKPLFNDSSEAGAGPSDLQSTSTDNGDDKGTTRRKSSGFFDSVKQPGSGNRRGSNAKTSSTSQCKTTPSAKSLADKTETSAMDRTQQKGSKSDPAVLHDRAGRSPQTRRTDDKVESVSGDSCNEIELSDSEDSAVTSNSASEKTVLTPYGSTPNSCLADRDTDTSPSTFSSCPTPDSSSDYGLAKRSSLSQIDELGASSSSTGREDTETDSATVESISAMRSGGDDAYCDEAYSSPQTETEYVDVNGYNGPALRATPFEAVPVKLASTRTTAHDYHEAGRDSASLGRTTAHDYHEAGRDSASLDRTAARDYHEAGRDSASLGRTAAHDYHEAGRDSASLGRTAAHDYHEAGRDSASLGRTAAHDYHEAGRDSASLDRTAARDYHEAGRDSASLGRTAAHDYHEAGRDSASPQTETDYLPHDDDGGPDVKTNRRGKRDGPDAGNRRRESLEPFITEQFLKMADPVDAPPPTPRVTSERKRKEHAQRAASESKISPDRSKRVTSTTSIKKGQSFNNSYDSTAEWNRRVCPKSTSPENEDDARSVSSSPDTIVEALDVMDLRESSQSRKIHRANCDVVDQDSDALCQVDER